MKIFVSILVAFLFFGATYFTVSTFAPLETAERLTLCVISAPASIAFGIQFYLQER